MTSVRIVKAGKKEINVHLSSAPLVYLANIVESVSYS